MQGHTAQIRQQMTFTCPFQNANLCTSKKEEVGTLNPKEDQGWHRLRLGILAAEGSERAAVAPMNMHSNVPLPS